MIEPVKMADFFVAFFSAASVILFGALYALLFAYSRVSNMPRLLLGAYAAYAALVASVIVLANVANLFGSLFWGFVVMLMLAGYLIAPHAIWHLCVSTQGAPAQGDAAVNNGSQPSTPLDSGTSEIFPPPL